MIDGSALRLDALRPEAATPLAARGFFFVMESRRAILLHANSLSHAIVCPLEVTSQNIFVIFGSTY